MMDEFFDKQLTEWTPGKIRKEIADGNYAGRTDLSRKNPKLYTAALTRKILDEFFDPRKWTPEKIRQEIKDCRYKNRTDLRSKNPNLYSAALRNNMLDEFFPKK
jgi:hypothetical protein